jgi:hypothetical protein
MSAECWRVWCGAEYCWLYVGSNRLLLAGAADSFATKHRRKNVGHSVTEWTVQILSGWTVETRHLSRSIVLAHLLHSLYGVISCSVDSTFARETYMFGTMLWCHTVQPHITEDRIFSPLKQMTYIILCLVS